MKYVYESTQPGLFNFTIPGENKTIHLFLGSKVTVNQKLSGGYLRVLKLVEEIEEDIIVEDENNQPSAKIEDKITQVIEMDDIKKDNIVVASSDTIINITEDSVTSNEKPSTKKIKKPIIKK